jgi:MFS family permease
MLIIWLQGIWLPLHGYDYEKTPLWSAIYMLPLTVGFLVSAPLSGILSDRIGSRWLATGGMVLSAGAFVLLELLPINFAYSPFAIVLLVMGLSMGLFSSPNRAAVMNSLPAAERGAGAGMSTTFQNSAMVLSIGFFFSLMILGLSRNLPSVMEQGLTAHGVPAAAAAQVAQLPPVGVLFAAFLGYNPVQQLLGPVLSTLPADQADFLTGRSFFPQLIAGPFADGLAAAFWFAVAACLVAAVASWFADDRRSPAVTGPGEPVGVELAAVAGETDGTFELVGPDDATATEPLRPTTTGPRHSAEPAPAHNGSTHHPAHAADRTAAQSAEPGAHEAGPGRPPVRISGR